MYFFKMKSILTAIFIIVFLENATSQFLLKKEVDGVQFYTKWGHEKWFSKKSPKVLLVKIINTTPYAVEFDMGVEFFMNMMLVEESKAKSYCLSGGKSLLPRVSGLIYKPESADPDSLDSFELPVLDIKKATIKDCSAWDRE